MNDKNTIKQTIRLIDTMIRNADKGPSGFWIEGNEGCGNPDVFPEFKESLKNDRLIQKSHKCCPWDNEIMYGCEKNVNLSGCYYHCGLRDAKFLSEKSIVNVLSRFKKNLEKGIYDNPKLLKPLLTEAQIEEIEYGKEIKEKEDKRIAEERYQKKVDLSAGLVNRLRKKEVCKEVIDDVINYYGESIVLCIDSSHLEGKPWDFSLSSYNEIASKKSISYDDFLMAQINTKSVRRGFVNCYYNFPCSFKGKIEKINEKHICFNKIYIEYLSGMDILEDKEEHVWIEKEGFEDYEIGDCLSFTADPYMYIKTKNGIAVDYGIRNPQDIELVEEYELPSNKELLIQELKQIRCEVCPLDEHCNRLFCLRGDSKEWNNVFNELAGILEE